MRALSATRARRAELGIANAPISLRYVVVGEPGNGQEQLLDVLASEMFRLGLISSAHVSSSPLVGLYDSLQAFRVGGGSVPGNSSEGVTDAAPGALWAGMAHVEAPVQPQQQQAAPPPEILLRESARIAATSPGFTLPLVLVLNRSMLAELDFDQTLNHLYPRRILDTRGLSGGAVVEPLVSAVIASDNQVLERESRLTNQSEMEAIRETSARLSTTIGNIDLTAGGQVRRALEERHYYELELRVRFGPAAD